MLDTPTNKPLSDFQHNANEHIKRLQESGTPEFLTVDGEVKVVVQDAGAYKELLKKIEQADTIQSIRCGMEQIERGEGQPIREALEEIGAEVGITLDE